MTQNRWDLSRSERKLGEIATLVSDAGRRRVLILCHTSPDPDTIASAYALGFVLKKKFSVRSTIGFGGLVTRAENQAMVHRLRIKMTQLSRVDPSRYYGIALVDAQPATGNNILNTRDQPPMIFIDHHPVRKASLKAACHDIRPSYGATSTILTEYVIAAGLTPTRSLANALLYGIKADTSSLARGADKADFNAFHHLSPMTNPRVLGWIEKPRLPMAYFEDYYRGLSNAVLFRDVAVSDVGKMHSEAIIPELADLLLRIDGVCWSMCMGEMDNLMILSLRTTSRTYRANSVLRRILAKSGSAGGHREMAGGQVPLDGMTNAERRYLAQTLVEKLLKLIDREGVHPKPLVQPNAHES
jgi:nanoRNase/pAp phosphatase (c-di-AMP/oligoRNAs hydrolase)